MNAVSNLENRTSPQASRQEASREVAISNSVTESNSSQQQLQANRSTNAPSPIEEHRNLFGYRPPSVTRNSNRQPPSKRRMVTTSTGERVSIPVRNTWSRTFVCLPNKNATTVPSASQKINMALAGLDERTICFTKGGNSEHVHKKILEAFPMLSDVGGYHILRTGERGNRQLLALTIPPGGYTVSFLKSTIASAKGYIRPYQKDIVIDNNAVLSQGQTQVCNFLIVHFQLPYLQTFFCMIYISVCSITW
jgi:hypothetical protein